MLNQKRFEKGRNPKYWNKAESVSKEQMMIEGKELTSGTLEVVAIAWDLHGPSKSRGARRLETGSSDGSPETEGIFAERALVEDLEGIKGWRQ